MRKYTLTIIIVLLYCCACNKQQIGKPNEVVSVTDSLPTLIMQIQQCSRIYTTEYKIHKIVTYDDVVQLKGTILAKDFNIKVPLGDRKIAIPMDATLKAYIDMNDFSERNIERTDGKIIVTLPDPKIIMTSSKIDQNNIKEYIGLVRSHFTDAEMTNYEKQGRAAIIENIPRLGIIPTAQENAARVLIPLFTQMGYKEEELIIQFRKEYDLPGIQSLINMNTENDKK